MTNRRTFTKSMCLGAAGTMLQPAFARERTQSASAQRPNILIIYVDDLALGDVGTFGCPDSATPNIDALAASGVKLTNAYTINACSSPASFGCQSHLT